MAFVIFKVEVQLNVPAGSVIVSPSFASQNQDHKRCSANLERGNAKVSDQFVLHRGGIQDCGGL